MSIHYGNRQFPVEVVENPGTGNNCLGFALGDMLRGEPSDLRDALCRFVESIPSDCDLGKSIACSILEDFESVPEDRQHEVALCRLRRGCFIPADLFVAYCHSGKDRRRLLKRDNVVFFAEREGSVYEPVCYYLDDVSRRTQYIGCDETHYEELRLKPRHELQFDVAFFGME